MYILHMMVDSLDVNGEAILASPSLTIAALSCSSISFNIVCNFFYNLEKQES